MDKCPAPFELAHSEVSSQQIRPNTEAPPRRHSVTAKIHHQKVVKEASEKAASFSSAAAMELGAYATPDLDRDNAANVGENSIGKATRSFLLFGCASTTANILRIGERRLLNAGHYGR